MKKITLILLALLGSIAANASFDPNMEVEEPSFEVDDICYRVTGESTVEVMYRVTYESITGTYQDEYGEEYDYDIPVPVRDYYSGDVTIPNSVISYFDDKTYTVTSIGENAFCECTGLTSVTIPNSVTNIGDWAFQYCSGLTSVTIPNSVTSIGAGAFEGCSGLTSVTIPVGVTNIGQEAFRDCSCLTSITIPESVTNIGYFAFYKTAWYNNQPDGMVYAGLVAYQYKGIMPTNTEIVLTDGTLAIGEMAFADCSGLTSITIPESVTSIGYYAFNGCSGLTAVTIESENPPTIDSNTFSNHANSTLYVPKGSKSAYESAAYWSEFGNIEEYINNIDFADANVKDLCVANWDTDGDGELNEREAAAVTNLGEVFRGNTEITSFDELQYFTGLDSIGNNTFNGCTSLTSITIPEGVTTIGFYAFRYCSGLTSLTIPESVDSIAIAAFEYCSGLTSITLPESLTEISNYMLAGCSSLTSVIIPEGVTSIGQFVFQNCSSLESITLPGSLTEIGYAAFYRCTSLASVAIPEGVTSIGDYAFSNCSSLASVTIPERVASIGIGVFQACALTSVTIPEGVTSIGDYAFNVCSNLASVTIPNSVTNISSNAFNGTAWLNNQPDGLVYAGRVAYKYKGTMPEGTEIVLDEGTVAIADLLFYNCSNLVSVTIPEGVMTIGNRAFYGCSSLASITIPSSVTKIGKTYESAFWGCSSLESISVESGNTVYDSRDNCNAIIETVSNTLIVGCKNTVIPSSVTSIGDDSFNGCGLESIDIPYNVTSIGQFAFGNCSNLTSVTIPGNVAVIGNYAFYGCNDLTSVFVGRETPPFIGDNTFPNRANATLYVPVGCKSAYESADFWSNFGEIIDNLVLYSIAQSTIGTACGDFEPNTWYLMYQGRPANGSSSYAIPNVGEKPASCGGYLTDMGEGQVVKKMAADDIQASMVRFVPTANSGAYKVQFATGRYMTDSNGTGNSKTFSTTASIDEAGVFNVYRIPEEDGASTNRSSFGFNRYNMQEQIDNDGTGFHVVTWSSGQHTSIQICNSIWSVVDVEWQDVTTLTLEMGSSGMLDIHTMPWAQIQTFQWSSSNENVVTVDASGKVTAVGVGTTFIMAHAIETNHTLRCTVQVYNKGDIDLDGDWDDQDIHQLAQIVVGNAEQHPAADFNKDGKVSLADVTALTNFSLTESQYRAAQASIAYEGTYRIYTLHNGSEVDGIRRYLTTDGYLTTNASEAGEFIFRRTEDESLFQSPGWKFDECFTNPKLNNGSLGEVVPQGHILRNTVKNRIDWEGQVWLKKGDTYAVRSTNAVSGFYGADSFWNVIEYNGQPTADYGWNAAYVWRLEQVW